MNPYTLFIGGERVATDTHAEVLNPSTGALVGLMPLATPDQLDRAVAAASEAFKAWSKTSDAERQAACHRVADAIDEHKRGRWPGC